MISSDWRRVLKCRSVRDKIAIAIDCDIAPVGDLPVVAELVREGIMVWIDRAMLPHLGIVPKVEGQGQSRAGVNADIYLLTPKGVQLCDAEGIPRQ